MAVVTHNMAADKSSATAGGNAKAVWIKRSFWIAVGLLIAVLIVLGVKSLLGGHTTTKKPVTTIKLLPDTPPPPPPPPKEPPKEQKEPPKEMKMEQPKPQETPQPPAPETLKMEGAAGDGPSPFGAGKVSNEYKDGDIGTKIGGKNSMAAFAWFTSQIKSRIEDALAAQKELAHKQYRVQVNIWFANDGHVERAELQGSSGDKETDDLIRKALLSIPAMSDSPPADMPQPVKLRVTSKNMS